MTINDRAYKDWCRRDIGATQLQRGALPLPAQLPKPQRAAGAPTNRGRPATTPHVCTSTTSSASAVPAATARLRTDHISEWIPPQNTKPLCRDPNKFDALSRTDGWFPHTANAPGAQRAVYDPLAHKSTVFTFNMPAEERAKASSKRDPMMPPTLPTVHRVDGKGDGLVRAKIESDLQKGQPWHGRRKGVVEFVDRTHAFAVNSNDAFIRSCESNPRVFHPKVGEMTNWFDNAIHGKMKVPFYGKYPYEMNK
uniref:Uncharacterized protein n=1 Tax=Chrysotila carterae TaxID=13221 RepID=A0A7S4AZS5_CHRCT|mmetsp:Transcript_9129/g.19787  ORF Transcript_9129/g.19787 Transcript_9129/m.19787 type:complete len:252 (+) Transcript_9129:485-1240(+)